MLNTFKMIELIHHLGMLNERSLLGAAAVAKAVTEAYEEANMTPDCSGALNDHLILNGIALACSYANTGQASAWLVEKVYGLQIVDRDGERGTYRWNAQAQLAFFKAIEKNMGE